MNDYRAEQAHFESGRRVSRILAEVTPTVREQLAEEAPLACELVGLRLALMEYYDRYPCTRHAAHNIDQTNGVCTDCPLTPAASRADYLTRYFSNLAIAAATFVYS